MIMSEYAEKTTLCSTMCNECGFLRDGIQNTLQPNVFDVINNRILFPCHLQLKAHTGFENLGTEIYIEESDQIKICRGYVESMYISGIAPANEVWVKLYKQLEDEGLDPRTMYIDEAIKYHEGSIYK